MAFQINVRSIDYPSQNPAQITYQTPFDIILDKQYSVSVANGNFVNSVPNLSAKIGNNIFKYYSPVSSSWKTITLPDGTYTCAYLDSQLQIAFTQNNDFTSTAGTVSYPIVFTANLYLDRVQMTINPNYQVDFTDSLLYQLLGFDSQIYDNSTANAILYTAPNIATFINRSSNFYIQLSLVSDGITINNQNSGSSGIIFMINGSTPSYGVSLQTSYFDRFYYKINTKRISSFTITFLDYYLNIADFQGEQINVLLDFRPTTDNLP